MLVLQLANLLASGRVNYNSLVRRPLSLATVPSWCSLKKRMPAFLFDIKTYCAKMFTLVFCSPQ